MTRHAPSRILVTGAAGYFGSVLVAALLRGGHRVVALDALLFGGHGLGAAIGDPAFQFIHADLRDAGVPGPALEGVHAVVHLAALVGHPICDKNTDAARRINIDATEALLALAGRAGVRRFLYASTCSNYGVTPPGILADESSPLHPLSVYAETKTAAGQLTVSAASSDFHTTVFRFATLYGMSPRMRFDLLLNELVRDAWISRAITLEGADMWRPFLHVRDAAAAVEAWLAAPDRDISGQVFNIAGDNIRKRDLGDLLKLVVPDLSVTLSGTAGEPRDYRVSVEKMRAILRFSPTRTTAEGVREIFDALEAGLVADPSSQRYTNLQWSHL